MRGPELFERKRITARFRLVPEDNLSFPGFLLRPNTERGETLDAEWQNYEDRPSLAHVDLTDIDLRGVKEICRIPGIEKARLDGAQITNDQLLSMLEHHPNAAENYIQDNWHWRSVEDYGRYRPIDFNGFDARKVCGTYLADGAFCNADLTGIENLEDLVNVEAVDFQGSKLTKEQVDTLTRKSEKWRRQWEEANRFFGQEPGDALSFDMSNPEIARSLQRRQQCLYGLDLTGVENIHLWHDFHNCDVRKVKLSNDQLREMFIKNPSGFGHYIHHNRDALEWLDLSRLDLSEASRDQIHLRELDLREADNIAQSSMEFYHSGKLKLTGEQLAALREASPKNYADFLTCNPQQCHLDGLEATNVDFSGVNLEGLDLSRIDNLEKSEDLDQAYLTGVTISNAQLRQLFIHQPEAFTKYCADNPSAEIDLTGLDVQDVTIHRQNLEGVDLRGVRNLEHADVRLLKGAIITPEQEAALRESMMQHGMEIIFSQLRHDVQPALDLPSPKVGAITEQPLISRENKRQ